MLRFGIRYKFLSDTFKLYGFDVETWNSAIEAAALIVEPNPHKDEERECKDVAKAIRSLKISG